jgi:hypothetical protein
MECASPSLIGFFMGHGGSESAAPPSAALLGALGALGLLRRPSSPRLRRGKPPDLIHALAEQAHHT